MFTVPATVTRLLLLLISVITNSDQFNINITEAYFNQLYDGNINQDTQLVFKYKLQPFSQTNNYLRANVTVDTNANKKCPTVFIFQRNDYVGSIKLPQDGLNATMVYYSSERTKGMDDNSEAMSNDTFLFVTVSTCSKVAVSFKLTIKKHQGYQIVLDEMKISAVSPISPIFYFFKFSEDLDMDYVTVFANSTAISSTYLSIQNYTCPVNDDISNIKHSGLWQEMSTRTVITVRRSDFPLGFHIVFLPFGKTDQSYLLKHRNLLLPYELFETETINFVVQTRYPDYLASLLVPLSVYLVIIVGTYIMYSYSHHLYIRDNPDNGPQPNCFDHCFDSCHNLFRMPLRGVVYLKPSENIFIKLRKHSYRYFWTMLIIAIFFGLPVYLLVQYLKKILITTGNMDTCSYNQFCSNPLLNFPSFNHLISTVGFPIFGLTFLYFVTQRARKLVVNDQVVANDENNKPWDLCCFLGINLTRTSYGAYQNFGIYFTLGLALIVSGGMELLFNVCPNENTSFFETSFLYVIILLSKIKIYGLRHAFVITDNFTFGIIAVVLLMVMLGHVLANSAVQLAISVVLSVLIQFVMLVLHSSEKVTETARYSRLENDGREQPDAESISQGGSSGNNSIRGEEGEQEPIANSTTGPSDLFLNIFRDRNWKSLCIPVTFTRTFWPFLRFFYNATILAFTWVAANDTQFTTKIFILLQGNFMLDFVYYFLIMKCCHKEYVEKISWQPVIHMFLAMISWGFAAFYFFSSTVAWEKGHTLAKEDYRDCQLWGFFDTADIYNLVVAPAWFFTFMVMLTADDALSHKRLNMVPLF